jgi:hypothetical protein
MSKTRLMQACGGVALAAGIGGIASNADAALTVDLRLADGGKSIVANAGDKIMADIWATVSGASSDLPNSYGLSSVNGSIVSQGDLRINIVGKQGDVAAYKGGVKTTALSPFAKSGEQPGNSADLDGDGDLDLGAPNQNDATGLFIARADPQEYFGSPANTGIAAGNGVAWKIGRIELTVAGNSGSANVVFLPRRNAAGAIAPEAGLWYDDQGGLSAKNATTGTFVTGAPLTIVVPEPGVIGTLALGAVGLLARRRK